MADYLNLMIHDTDTFIELVSKAPFHQKVEELNRRRYDALDGTILHLVIMGLLEPTNNIAFDDNTALKLVSSMIDNGACPLIESFERKIPYELFHLYDVDPLDYQTYKYLLAKTTSNLLENTCKREFYEDYINEDHYYNFDRAYSYR